MKLVFDIGYNRGRFAKACFDKYPDVKVVGVEANPALCPKKTRAGLTVINRLVSDRDNVETDFYVDRRRDGISTASMEFIINSRFRRGSRILRRGTGNWATHIKVKSITLDTLIGEHGIPDLIKIDVEGYDHIVLFGLSRKVKDICFEWHEEMEGGLDLALSHLLEIGYEKFGVIGFFAEGDVFEKATFVPRGDTPLVYPKNFYSIDDLDVDKLIKHGRRINYGMLFVKA